MQQIVHEPIDQITSDTIEHKQMKDLKLNGRVLETQQDDLLNFWETTFSVSSSRGNDV